MKSLKKSNSCQYYMLKSSSGFDISTIYGVFSCNVGDHSSLNDIHNTYKYLYIL